MMPGSLDQPPRRRVRHAKCRFVTVLPLPLAVALDETPEAVRAIRCASCERDAPVAAFCWIQADGRDGEQCGSAPQPMPQPEPEPPWPVCHHGAECHEYIFSELQAIRAQLDRIEQNEGVIMTDQDTLNQVAATIEGDVAAINAGVTAVQAEIASLQQAAQSGQPLDFTSVNSALADLQNSAASVSAAGAEVPPAAPPGDASGDTGTSDTPQPAAS